MKSAYEIKKAMECCMGMECRECPYRGEKCTVESAKDVLTYIKQLEDYIGELTEKIPRSDAE